MFVERGRFELDDLRSAITAEAPDVLVIDTNAWGAAAVADASGLPWASIQPFPTPLPAPGVPPFGPGLRPRRDAVGRARDGVLRPLVIGAVQRAVLGPLNEVRRGAGAPPLEGIVEQYLRPPLTLYLTSRAFEHPREEWPDSFCFTGPLAWDPRAAPFDVPPGPVALVTTSSEFQADGVLVRTARYALDGTDLTVLATMPAGASVTDVPRNARVEEFVPHSQVLPHAAVAVTHGGMGATQRALAAGVPVVVVPFGRDQAEVGRRAERAGAGVLLPRRRLTAPRLRAAVREARTLQPAAQRLARAMAEEAGAAGAADRLEALVRDWR
ncbi:MGT family glycosyltransferase [Nocardioides sp. J9]|nr:MGT family glycosyltransferase [Nocardioides sp. J9]